MVTGEKIGGDDSGKTGWEDMEDWKGSGGGVEDLGGRDNPAEFAEEPEIASAENAEVETVADEKDEWIQEAEDLRREAREVVRKMYYDIFEKVNLAAKALLNEINEINAKYQELLTSLAAERTEIQGQKLRLKDELMAVDAEIRRARQEAEETKEQAQHDYGQAEMAADGGDGETAYSYLRAYRNGAGEYERKARLFEGAVKKRDEYATEVRETLGDDEFGNFINQQRELEAEASAMRRDAEREGDESDEKTARLSQKMLARRMSDNTRRMFDI